MINERILALEITEVDDTFSRKENTIVVGRGTKFYIVPTELVISGDRELWKGCPHLVNWDILKCIEEIVENGEYPYNSTVGELFCKKFNLPIKYEDGTFLSAMVYCTQSYRHSVQDEIKAKEFHEKATASGYIKATEELLNSVVNTTRRFYIIANGITWLGDDVQIEKKDKLLLKDWGAQGLHWMNPRAKRKGYRALVGQYVKEC